MIEHCSEGTHMLEDPVSKITLKYWPGVPMYMGPKYWACGNEKYEGSCKDLIRQGKSGLFGFVHTFLFVREEVWGCDVGGVVGYSVSCSLEEDDALFNFEEAGRKL